MVNNKYKFIKYIFSSSEDYLIVSVNFFGEKHGKNGRDTHFSQISKFIKAESLLTHLISSQDVVNAINKRTKLTNDYREFKGRKTKTF
jgi:hypothetical protein